MIASDSNIKRVLQQLQRAAADVLGKADRAFGLAIGFMTTTFTIANQVARSNKPYAATLQATQRAIIEGAVNAGTLTVTESKHGNGESEADAHYRHIRNCFAHCNWAYDEATVTNTSMEVFLEDHNDKGLTFAGRMQLPDLVILAERLLVETFKAIP